MVEIAAFVFLVFAALVVIGLLTPEPADPPGFSFSGSSTMAEHKAKQARRESEADAQLIRAHPRYWQAGRRMRARIGRLREILKAR